MPIKEELKKEIKSTFAKIEERFKKLRHHHSSDTVTQQSLPNQHVPIPNNPRVQVQYVPISNNPRAQVRRIATARSQNNNNHRGHDESRRMEMLSEYLSLLEILTGIQANEARFTPASNSQRFYNQGQNQRSEQELLEEYRREREEIELTKEMSKLDLINGEDQYLSQNEKALMRVSNKSEPDESFNDPITTNLMDEPVRFKFTGKKSLSINAYYKTTADKIMGGARPLLEPIERKPISGYVHDKDLKKSIDDWVKQKIDNSNNQQSELKEENTNYIRPRP